MLWSICQLVWDSKLVVEVCQGLLVRYFVVVIMVCGMISIVDLGIGGGGGGTWVFQRALGVVGVGLGVM